MKRPLRFSIIMGFFYSGSVISFVTITGKNMGWWEPARPDFFVIGFPAYLAVGAIIDALTYRSSDRQ